MWIGLILAFGSLNGVTFGNNWECPDVSNVSCSCDLPQTLRCRGSISSLTAIAETLRALPRTVSLLDYTVQNLTSISGPIFQGVALHGLVISSGELTNVTEQSFLGLEESLQVLGLPNNKLSAVPTKALTHLQFLSRLDLSHNALYTLQKLSFKGLASLKYLDLSANFIRIISNSTFSNLIKLKILRLQSNRLNFEVIASLRGLTNLEELDLSYNILLGPLGSSSLPQLPNLITLNLAHNQLSSVTKGALNGLDSLRSLSLRNNMIDVLEDHAFRELAILTELDLAYNRMVVVSEASLAHLNTLKLLDVSHNFLRALTSDLISPLESLKQLKLDNNDISIVNKNALKSGNNLKSLTLSDNPLNCDCSLASFAEWLKNSSISKKDKVTATCATPPSLENGLVLDLSPRDLLCEQEEYFTTGREKHLISVSGTRVTLQGFSYNGKNISLLWAVNTKKPYDCDALYVYEVLGTHQVEVDKLNCHLISFEDSHSLSLTLEAPPMQSGHRYRYCLVMIERHSSGESSLVVGCSEILTLGKQSAPFIISLAASLISPNTLALHANVWPKNQDCTININISSSSKQIEKLILNCSSPYALVGELEEQGPFKICASISKLPPYCIWSKVNYKAIIHTHPSFLFFLFCIMFLTVILTILLIFRCLRKVVKSPKLHEQCFLHNEHIEQQHSRYVKLQATTKL